MSEEKNEGFANSDGVGGAARSDALGSDGGAKFPNASDEKETNEMIESSEAGLGELQDKKPCRSLHWKVEFVLSLPDASDCDSWHGGHTGVG